MAGKMRAWAKSVPPETKQKMWSELKEAGVNEARFARDDIRQKVVEEGWSGSVQTPRGVENYSSHDTEEPNTFEVEATETDWQAIKEDAHKQAGIDQLGHTPEQQIEWERHKATAEELYGNDSSEYQGTVWENENRHGIEPPAPDAHDIQPPDDGIEPG